MALNYILQKFERHLVFITIFFFILGIYIASIAPWFGALVNSMFGKFIDGYAFIAPLFIFVILTPTLAKILRSRKKEKFGFYTIKFFAKRKLMASIWAIIFTVVVFRFTLLPQSSLTLLEAFLETSGLVLRMLTHSSYFYALYASIIVALISLKIQKISNMFDLSIKAIEDAGAYFQYVVPLFMLAVGSYVYSLPQNIGTQIGLDTTTFSFNIINIFGFSIDPNTSTGMVLAYLIGSFLIAIACLLWDFYILLITKYKTKKVTIKGYYKDYWIKVYPLLWSTSSEAIATPLNLYLTKKNAPWVKTTVRRFVIATGGFMDSNGTLISVFIVAGLVGAMLGLNFSLVGLLLTVPLLFIISYAVPGIPGELVIFAGPLATLLAIPETILPVFLALYIGLQLGLPDSFRTGSNSTDDYLNAILLNEVYEEKFREEELEQIE